VSKWCTQLYSRRVPHHHYHHRLLHHYYYASHRPPPLIDRKITVMGTLYAPKSTTFTTIDIPVMMIMYLQPQVLKRASMDAWQILHRPSCLSAVHHCNKAHLTFLFIYYLLPCFGMWLWIGTNKVYLLVFIVESVTRQRNSRDLKLVGGVVMGPNKVKQNSPNNNS